MYTHTLNLSTITYVFLQKLSIKISIRSGTHIPITYKLHINDLRIIIVFQDSWILQFYYNEQILRGNMYNIILIIINNATSKVYELYIL